jgi:hypothetical protein
MAVSAPREDQADKTLNTPNRLSGDAVAAIGELLNKVLADT